MKNYVNLANISNAVSSFFSTNFNSFGKSNKRFCNTGVNSWYSWVDFDEDQVFICNISDFSPDGFELAVVLWHFETNIQDVDRLPP